MTQSISPDLINRLYLFLGFHEIAYIVGDKCPVCTNFIYPKLLDQDIDNNLIKNYCKSDKELVDKIILKKLTSKAQRIHIIGNHWPIVNSFKHRKFNFFCGIQKKSSKDSICITDTSIKVDKIDNKLIITQGYKMDYNLDSVDYLLIEKKYLEKYLDTENIPFHIPDKGYLVTDLRNGQKFYTEDQKF